MQKFKLFRKSLQGGIENVLYRMKIENLKDVNTAALAYMGDAVYEQAVREHILKQEIHNTNKLHHMATGFVKASAQAGVMKAMFDELTEQEQKLVKRARNRKYATKAKNADPVTYKWATAFEALVGYLYLAEDDERLAWVLARAMEIAGGRHVKKTEKEETDQE